MTAYPHCKTCEAMCYSEQMIEGECVPCTRKTMKKLRKQLKKLEKERRT